MERRELRLFPSVELRVDGDDQPKIVGHAAVYGLLSEPLMGFREKIAPGAFTKTIQSADVRGLLNHDRNFVLGRTKAGTLRLSEDSKGLAMENDPPATQWAADLLVSMRRGDINQMSFAFYTIKDKWETTNGETIRTLEEVELLDVSVVTVAAYPQTDVAVRSLEAWKRERGMPTDLADKIIRIAELGG